MNIKPLPIGGESFEKVIEDNCYYVDKTGMITDLIESRYEVTLFTRPRRFGKTLNMDMLRCFFDSDLDKDYQKSLFKNLDIFSNADICKEYMGKYPVISITLKDVSGEDFSEAKTQIKSVIGKAALRYKYVLDDKALTDEDKDIYKAIIAVNDGEFAMDDSILRNSLMNLTHILEKYYGQKVILLIDEYDVPLDKAHSRNYYDQMSVLIRDILSATLKSNSSIKFSVMTGCLRIAKESIFTGLNNLRVQSISDVGFSKWFGFTDEEVDKMLGYYDLIEKKEVIKEWYDGYRFGNISVYCPWDVINYVQTLRSDIGAMPELYWANTSSNDLLLNMIAKPDEQVKHEIEALLAGESIEKDVHNELTYRDIDESIDNVWSVLYTTGYLTMESRSEDGKYKLKVPNREIYILMKKNIYDFVKREAKDKSDAANRLFRALTEKDTKEAENIFADYLITHISIRDTSVKKEMKENFYHGYLLGLLSAVSKAVVSNRESGEGYADILIKAPEKRVGVVLEIKYAEDENLDKYCDEALTQIRDKNYEQSLIDDGMDTIIRYGVACYKKRCRIKCDSM